MDYKRNSMMGLRSAQAIHWVEALKFKALPFGHFRFCLTQRLASFFTRSMCWERKRLRDLPNLKSRSRAAETLQMQPWIPEAHAEKKLFLVVIPNTHGCTSTHTYIYTQKTVYRRNKLQKVLEHLLNDHLG